MDNALSIYWHSLSKDCPGKVWWSARPSHPAIYRALQIKPNDHGAIYACAPFRIHKVDGAARVLAAYPAPMLFDAPDYHWLAIETVVSWNPVTDRAEVMGDPSPQIVGAMSEDANALFSSPRAFFQRWAIRRAQFAVQRQVAKRDSWQIGPRERDEVPGGLVIGATADIRWQPSIMPEHIECVGINPQVVNKAILRAARLPRATGSAQ